MAHVLLPVPVHLRGAGIEHSWSAKCVLRICRPDISTGRPYSKSRTWRKAARSLRVADRGELLGRSWFAESAARPELHLLPDLCSLRSWNLLLCEFKVV